MRVCCSALLLVGAAGLVAACGEDDFENKPRPAAAITLTGVIQDRGVTISPRREGAGPFLISISNQTDESHTVTLEGESVKEEVGPVQPRDTAEIQKTLAPGTYEVRAGSPEATSEEIPPATITIGPERASSNDRLLRP